MKKTLIVVGTLGIMIGLGLGGIALGNGGVKGSGFGIMVSPQMIVLDKVDDVTVHTNIPAAGVEAGTLALNGVAPEGVWADNRGHLVARFGVAELALTPADAVTLTLSGVYVGDTFSVDDIVRVK